MRERTVRVQVLPGPNLRIPLGNSGQALPHLTLSGIRCCVFQSTSRFAGSGAAARRSFFFEVTQTQDPNATLPRFLIVAPPKAASTYVANVVRRYFQIDELPFSNEVDWTAEHNLTPMIYLMLRGHGFCFNFHMLAHRMNLQIAEHERIGLIAIWRNLGDIIVSARRSHLPNGRERAIVLHPRPPKVRRA